MRVCIYAYARNHVCVCSEEWCEEKDNKKEGKKTKRRNEKHLKRFGGFFVFSQSTAFSIFTFDFKIHTHIHTHQVILSIQCDFLSYNVWEKEKLPAFQCGAGGLYNDIPVLSSHNSFWMWNMTHLLKLYIWEMLLIMQIERIHTSLHWGNVFYGWYCVKNLISLFESQNRKWDEIDGNLLCSRRYEIHMFSCLLRKQSQKLFSFWFGK